MFDTKYYQERLRALENIMAKTKTLKGTNYDKVIDAYKQELKIGNRTDKINDILN